MSDEQRLQEIEARLDRVAATNVGLRETIVLLQDQVSSNRVEILALRYLADRSFPLLPSPAVRQATSSPSLLPPAAIRVTTDPRSRPRIPVRDSSAPPLRLGLPLATVPHQSPHSSVTPSPRATLQDELNLLQQVSASITNRENAAASTANSVQTATPFPRGAHVTVQRGKSARANARKIFSVVGPKGEGGNYTYIVDVSTDGNSKPVYKANTSLSLAIYDEE